MHRKGFVRATILIGVLAMAVPVFAEHAWGNYHWGRTTTSFNLLVVDSVTAEWQYAFDQSLAKWSISPKFDNVVGAVDEGSRTRKRCPMVSGQMRVCNAAYGQNGWLGLASINITSAGHITQGTAKVNDSYDWYFASYEGEDNHVMCQEIGHVYGLGHTTEDGSSQSTCMDYSNSLQSQWPNTHDYQQLDIIYGHTDSVDTYDTGGSSGGDGGDGGECNAPPGKGCNKNNGGLGAPDGVPPGALLVHYRAGRDGHKGHADYVMPDDAGGWWLYHVTLVPEDLHPGSK